MDFDEASDSHKLKNMLFNLQEPIIIKNKLNWDMLKWSLDDWETILKNEKLQFRCGKNEFSEQPQWERSTECKTATFKEFLSATQLTNSWMYFDYKYLKEWFNGVDKLKKNINWSPFGFPELGSEHSTIWIGSSGAHTPCHIDTYGCNLVAQIYGRKQWILSPPDENLKPTRIPYEESSIYSELNFFSPNLQDFEGVKSCRKIILEPGDVLFVPHHWWHYVENLDVAISVNVWIPLPRDHEERLKESLVQLFFNQITKTLDDETKNLILNPNSDEDVGNVTLNGSIELVMKCREVVKKTERSKHTTSLESCDVEQCFKKYSFLHKIPTLSRDELYRFLEMQRNRFSVKDKTTKHITKDMTDVINVFTCNDVMTLIKNKLLE